MICKTCKDPELFSKGLETFEGNVDNITTRTVFQYINALDTGESWDHDDLKFYFYKTTDDARIDDGGESLRDWSDTQKNAWRTAITEWDKVSGLTLTETANIGEADIKLFLIDDESYPYLGHAYFPGSAAKGENFISYNNAADKNYTQGSYDYITLVHELGHTLGLAHPHDTGGLSTTFPGVTSWSDLGDNQQNQTIFTVMSYNDLNGPLTPNNVQSHGFVGGPMAYDIKTIHMKYAGNIEANAGDDTYILPSTNEVGTFWTAIHDTGGNDTIDASGATGGVRIELGSASVDGGKSGGGRISQQTNIDGGFTIASETVIENATGGSHADTLIGNQTSNKLVGGSGNDTLRPGSAGNDYLYGNAGNDKFYADGRGYKLFVGGSGTADTVYFKGSRRNYWVSKYNDRWVFRGLGRYRQISGVTSLRSMNYIKFSRYRSRIRMSRIRPNRRYRRRY